MSGFLDKLGDLSWLGPDYVNQGWFEVGEDSNIVSEKEAAVLKQANDELRASDWTMLADAPLTVSQKQSWIEYRRWLRDIKVQRGFPENVQWPNKPE